MPELRCEAECTVHPTHARNGIPVVEMITVLLRFHDADGREWSLGGVLRDDLTEEDGARVRLMDLPRPLVPTEIKVVEE